MALTKYKLGDLIEESFRKNSSLLFGVDYVRGISNNKEIQQTKADVDESVIHKFYIVNPGEFVYNPRTTRMGDKVGLGYNDTKTPLLFSFNNIAFFIKDSAKSKILPEYLYMLFKRPEFDRYAITNSWGSATELFSFDEMCDITLDLPSLDIQKKYVAIYNSLLANQKSYERGLEDLNIACVSAIEQLKHDAELVSILPLLTERQETNKEEKYNDFWGVGNEGFISPRGDRGEDTFYKCNIFYPKDFVYNPSVISKGAIAYNSIFDTPKICTEEYIVFHVTDEDVLSPEYLFLWMKRKETGRYLDFINMDSVRNRVYFRDLECIKIPFPDIETQRSIAKLYKAYHIRRSINERLKSQIRDACPILIKGSVEEAQK